MHLPGKFGRYMTVKSKSVHLPNSVNTLKRGDALYLCWLYFFCVKNMLAHSRRSILYSCTAVQLYFSCIHSGYTIHVLYFLCIHSGHTIHVIRPHDLNYLGTDVLIIC